MVEHTFNIKTLVNAHAYTHIRTYIHTYIHTAYKYSTDRIVDFRKSCSLYYRPRKGQSNEQYVNVRYVHTYVRKYVNFNEWIFVKMCVYVNMYVSQ